VKYIDEFRDGQLAKNLALSIAAEVRAGRSYSFMEFCGGHTHAISRYGLTDLLPPSCAWSTAPAARSACCPSAASTWPSSWP
jgi:hydrogenase expression/formation protein HypD